MSLAGLPLALTVASGAISAYGQFQQAKAQQKAAEFNAAAATQQAEIARKRGDIEKRRLQKEKQRFLARQKTLFIKGGVRLEGSPVLVMADSAAEFEQDIQIAEFNALTDVNTLQTEAEVKRLEARNARLSGLIGAGRTLLTTSVKAVDFFAPAKKD